MVPYFDALLYDTASISDYLLSVYVDYNNLFREFLETGVDIHLVVGRRTCLLSFIFSYIECFVEKGLVSVDINPILRVWLKSLQYSGINLNEFGDAEKQLFDKDLVEKEISIPWRSRNERLINQRLINFTYGSSTEDWYLWMSEPTDSLAGEFWEMMERKEEVMPGTWSEAFDDDD
jgi:hypothetical protein